MTPTDDTMDETAPEASGGEEIIVPDGPGTAEVRIGTGTALDLTARIVTLGTSFIMGVLVARIFGVDGKGALSILMQVPGILVVVLDLGISTSTLYFVSSGKLKPGTAAANALVIAAILGALGSPFVYLLLSGPFAILPGVPAMATFIAIAILPLGLLAGWLGGISTGLSNLRLPVWCAIASSSTTLVGLVFLLLSGRDSLTDVLAASVAGSVVGLLVLLGGLRTWLKPFRVDLASGRMMARFSAKAYLSSIAGLLHERQDVLVLGWLAGATAVGLYSVGVSFAELTWYVPTALGTAILAKGSRRSELSAAEYTARSARVAIVFMAVTVVLSLAVVPLLVPFVYGRAFAPAVSVFIALLPGVLADGVSRILWNYQTTRGRLYWRLSIGTTVLNLGAVIVLVSMREAVGAALASSISYSVLSVLVVRRFCADTGIPVVDVLVPRRDDIAGHRADGRRHAAPLALRPRAG